jgi:ribosome-associated protein
VETLEVGGKLRIPISEFDLSFARGGGPGGQNVNKVNSKAVLYWTVISSPSVPEAVRQRFMARYHHRISTDGVLVMSSDRHRDQKRNVEDCLEKLTEMLATVLEAPKPRKKTKPTRGSNERRLRGKSENKAKKQARRDKGDW